MRRKFNMPPFNWFIMYQTRKKSTFNLAVGYGLMIIGALGLAYAFGLIWWCRRKWFITILHVIWDVRGEEEIKSLINDWSSYEGWGCPWSSLLYRFPLAVFINRRIFYPDSSRDLTLEGLWNVVNVFHLRPKEKGFPDDSANDGYNVTWIVAIIWIHAMYDSWN